MPTRDELLEAYALPGRPDTAHVRMNFVASADGAVTLGGRSGELGGETDRALMQVLRTMADVVLVGAGTVRAEGYGGIRVDDDAVAWRREHGFADQPVLAVVSGGLHLAARDDVFARAAARPVVVTTDASRRHRGADFEPVADVLACGAGGFLEGDRVDLVEMLAAFAQRGWTRVLCEGGPHLFGSLLEADLVTEVALTVSPRFVGGRAGRIVQGIAEDPRRFALAGVRSDDDGFVFLRYVRV